MADPSQPGVERELKLVPTDAALLDRLASSARLGPFAVVSRGRELQRSSFFDTRTGALRAARLALRRRTRAGQRLATWTLKGEGDVLRGIAARPEVEVLLDPDTPPALAIGVLAQAARQRGSAALADALAGSLSPGEPLARPYLELETERRTLALRAAAEGWEAELALDRVRLLGHPGYAELEIEVELRRGDDQALEAARRAIAALGPAREAAGSKLSRALAHLSTCHCREQANR